MPVTINYVKGKVIINCPCGAKLGKIDEGSEEYRKFINSHNHHEKGRLNL